MFFFKNLTLSSRRITAQLLVSSLTLGLLRPKHADRAGVVADVLQQLMGGDSAAVDII